MAGCGYPVSEGSGALNRVRKYNKRDAEHRFVTEETLKAFSR